MRRFAQLSVFLLVTAVFSAAATLTVTCVVPSPVLTQSAPSAFFNAVCPQFNPALGNLTQAVYLDRWDAFTGTSITLQNSTGSTANLAFTVPLTLSSSIGPFPGGNTTATTNPAAPLFVNGTLGAGTTQAFTPTGTAGFVVGLSATLPSLTAIKGTGSFSLPVQVFATPPGQVPSGISLTAFSVSPTNAFGSSLTYTYDAVPEPATWSVGLLAVTWLAARRTRQERSS